jgi:hypothetical protein
MDKTEQLKLLNKGTSCFLVRFTNDDENEKLLKYLKENDYNWVNISSSIPRGPWYFINLNTKMCIVGRVGIGQVSEVVGNHAISVDEFIKIAEIYKKYESLKILDLG